MKEILPGVVHWKTTHPKHGIEVSSHYLLESQVLIDPFQPSEGWHAFASAPQHILLTNRHHYRDSGEFVERFGCKVWCVESGLHEFTNGEPVQGFQFGDELPGGIVAVEIGSLCPDETAFYIPVGDGILSVADGVVRANFTGDLCFVPDGFMGDDPEAVKAGLKAAYRKALEREFDTLLFAHGAPWVGGAKAALAEFVAA